jgi:hypothetical protein
MRGAGGGRGARRAARAVHAVVHPVVHAVLAIAVALAVAACGTSGAEPTAVPTFPAPAGPDGAATGSADDGRVVPADCGRILGPPDLEAVLGLPLGSVTVRTTVGVPQPAVGRTERVTCRYTRVGDNGRPLLDINASAYRDAAAAAAQWQVNIGAESGDRRDVPLGSASAVLFEKRGQAALMVAHSTSNLTLVLPDQPLPGGKSRADALIDLALRVLPNVSVEPATAPPSSLHTGPASQAGAAQVTGR